MKKYLAIGFLAGVLGTVFFANQFDCGEKVVYIPELDSAKARSYIEVGIQRQLNQEKKELDSLRVELAAKDSGKKTRYVYALKNLSAPTITGADSLKIIQALVNDNIQCREVVMLADTLIRGYEMQLLVANSRMAIDDSLGNSLMRERLELKNIIRLQDQQIRELTETSWWEEHKFELGFFAGAALTTAVVILK